MIYRLLKLLTIGSALVGIVCALMYPPALLVVLCPFPTALGGPVHLVAIFLYVITPSLGLVLIILGFRDRQLWGKIISIVLVPILVVSLLSMTHLYSRKYAQEVTSPSVVTAAEIPVYRRCIAFAAAHGELDSFTFSRGYRIRINGGFFMLRGNKFEINRARQYLPAEFISEVEDIFPQIYSIGCIRFQKADGFLLFYKVAHALPPNGPGLLYSPAGTNPNTDDSPLLKSLKPLEKITGNWYASRSLMLKGPRCDMPYSMNESVFQSALEIDERVKTLLAEDATCSSGMDM